MPHQRKTFLLLIGIDHYQHWKPLAYPVRDCEGFFEVLKNHYGFSEADLIHENKRPLFNAEATGDMIFDELYRLSDKDETGKPHLSPEDNLVVYFAGHGHLGKTVDEGYWVPADGPQPKRHADLKKFISVSEVIKILSSIPAHHIVLIVDSCFPQTFARITVDVPPGGDPNNPGEKPSRWALTSGRLEPVADKSPFALALRDLLENNDKPRLSVVKLGADIMERVRESSLQNAWSASLTENRFDGGEFFFHRRSPIPVSDAESLPQRMRLGSKQYLDRLKAGRFKYLRIEKLLLPETDLPDFVDVQVKVHEQVSPLQKAVQSLWGQAQPHAVLLGEGGMGKTVSLLRLWEDWLDASAAAVPVFVALNEYNALREEERYDFVLRSIARNCGLAESLTAEWKNALGYLLRQPRSDGSPSILLLLDGFNEVTPERTPLLVELNRLAQEARGLQMVITSRYTEIRNFQWAQQSEILNLQALTADKIGDYLRRLSLPVPQTDAMQRLLGNPMMLTIYAGSNQIARRFASDARFRFLPTASVGELLWNFTEAQLVKYYEDHSHDPDEQIWHRFLLRFLLPYLAWRMEERGDFFLAYRRRSTPEFNFQLLLNEAFETLNRPELTDISPEFEGKRALLGLGTPTDLDAREQRARRVREYLVDKLALLVLEKDELRFLHQNLRDFFAACHLLNMVDIGMAAPTWTDRALPVYLRRMLAQIEGEHHYAPQKVRANTPMPGFQAQNRLAHALDQCRGTYHYEPTQTAVMNLVRTLVDGRKTLAGADLRSLDLQKVCLNGIALSVHLGRYRYLPVRLEEGLVNGKLLFSQGHSDLVNSVCYSPDGKKILSGSGDGTIKEWSVESGECLQTLQGHSNEVSSVCYSLDGKKILSGSNDNRVKEWSVKSGECLQTLQEHRAGVNSVCYSPDGKKILSGSGDGTIKEWSVESGECLQTLQGHSNEVSSVCYSLDGKKILSGSQEHTIKEWSVESGECLQTLDGHSNSVRSVCYSPDGKRILSGSNDNTVKEWSVESGECLQTLAGYHSVNSACYSPDGKKILSGSGDGTIKEWSVESGECLQTLQGHSNEVSSVCYSLDGKKILSGSQDYTVKEWSIESGECLQTLDGCHNSIRSVCYSLDGEKILSGSNDNTVKEWCVENGYCLQTLQGHFATVKCVSCSPDGKKILSGSHDGTVKEWSVESGECLQSLQENYDTVEYVSYSPDGKKILVLSGNHFLEEFTVGNEELQFFFPWFFFAFVSVSYSPDGKKILAGSLDGRISEWSIESGKCLQTLRGHRARVNSVCYSPKGEKILSGSSDLSVREWLVESGECLQSLHVYYNQDILSVSYSPDGKKILSLSRDGTIKEWSAESGECLQTLREHDIVVNSVCYSPDGKKILSGSGDGTIKEWSLATGDCLRTLHNEVGLLVHGCDFSRCHPDSVFTEEEKARLRQYGAIFEEKDRARWETGVEDVRGGL